MPKRQCPKRLAKEEHPTYHRRVARLDLTQELSYRSHDYRYRSCTIAVCLLLSAGCGSVGSGLKVDSGTGGSAQGGSTGAGGATTGTGGAASGAGGAGGSVDASVDAPHPGTGGGSTPADAATDRTGAADAPADAGPSPVSCQAIKQQNPAATSGVYTIAPLGTPQSTFCEMTSGGGGWTAFYIGDNGSSPGGQHFESAADACPDPANSCLRRLPSTIDVTREFAVKCGLSVVKFNLEAMALDFFTNGLDHGWRPLTNAVTIDTGLVGKANLVANVWTGGPVANYGWIIAGPDAPASNLAAQMTTFGNGYTPNTGWNYCNGMSEIAPGSRVMLFYR